MLRRTWSCLAVALALTTTASGQEASLKLADLAWLAGGWSGEAFGGPCDEYWSPPTGGQIMGMFRLGSPEQTRVVEFISIVQDPDGKLTYRFRHFSPALKSWDGEEEHPLEFAVSRQGADGFLLQGLEGQSISKMVIQRQGDDQYTTTVHTVRDGKPASFDVTVKRQAVK